jgi:hypothetical protein
MSKKQIHHYLLSTVLSPLFIALTIGIASYYGYFHSAFGKYDYTVLNIQNTEDIKYYFVDLDNDGVSEKIFLGHELESKAHSFIVIYLDPLNENTTLSQYNFDATYVRSSSMIFTDIDNDSIKELFLFTLKDSCVYLNGFKYHPSSNISNISITPIITDVKITNVNLKNDNYEDFAIFNADAIDINNDCYQDLVFCITGKYSAYPRKIFVYDIKKHKLISSPGKYRFSTLSISTNTYSHSNKTIILPKLISVPMNIGDSSIIYHDRSSWVVAFNDSLLPLFAPIKLGYGFKNSNLQLSYSNDSIEGFISLHMRTGKDVLSLYSLKGDTINQIYLDYKHVLLYPSTDNDKYMCSLLVGQELLGITHNMKIVSLTQFSDYNSKISNFRFIDIDKDPKKEIFLCNNYGREIQLFDDDFTKILSIPNEDLGGLVKAHTIKSNYKENYIYIEGDKKTQLIKYYKNKDYFLSFLIPSFITILFYFIIYFALKQREKAIKQKHQQEKDLIEAQLKIANKQMSPHFQLNVLNAVSYLFDKDKDKAQYYMGKYARLVTHIMMNVDKINTSLSNEISFTTNYLSLEQLRLEYKFDFEVHIDEQVDKHLIIPRMLIFTFCENAVKHGLFHKESKGSLTVDIKKLDGSIVLIQIEDNGIGRNKAKSLNTGGTGMGLKTLNKIIKFYNSVNKSIINYQIEDITDKEGTRVTVTIKRKGEE